MLIAIIDQTNHFNPRFSWAKIIKNVWAWLIDLRTIANILRISFLGIDKISNLQIEFPWRVGSHRITGSFCGKKIQFTTRKWQVVYQISTHQWD